MPEEPSVWEIRLGVCTTREEAEQVKERIKALLCPDPDHAPPCPVPWEISMLHESDLDEPGRYETLAEQAAIERGLHSR